MVLKSGLFQLIIIDNDSMSNSTTAKAPVFTWLPLALGKDNWVERSPDLKPHRHKFTSRLGHLLGMILIKAVILPIPDFLSVNDNICI